MPKQNSMTVIAVQSEYVSELTFEELCAIYPISFQFIEEVIEHGIIDPLSGDPKSWVFSGADLRKIRTILHLQEDLEINMAGAALILDLMDELENVRSRLEILEKKYY